MLRFHLIMGVMLSLTVLCSAQFAGGSGTENDPWLVANAEHLNNVRIYLGIEHSDKYFLQIADINLNVPPWNQGEGWNPIGTSGDLAFSGYYDGDNYIIDGLYIFIETEIPIRCGLFGFISGATISNVALTNIDINTRFASGGLIGRSIDSTITNCNTSGIINSEFTVGGLIGSTSTSIIVDSYSSTNVSGDYVGGLIGQSSHSNISNCYSTGEVSSIFTGGGLIGVNAYSTVDNCSSMVNVNGYEQLGGLVGDNYASTIINSNSSGNVSGYLYVGGLAGRNISNSMISNCYSTGSVTANQYVGGLVGVNHVSSSINDSYSTGNVNCINYAAGGLVGSNSNNSTIVNSYSHSNVEGMECVGGLAGTGGGQISNCFSTGIVIGEESVGGFVGQVSSAIIENCYSLSDVTGEYFFGGYVGQIQNTTIVNSHYNYDLVSINDQHAITIGALNDSMFTTWMDNNLTLHIADYLDFDGENYLIASINDIKMMSAFGQLSGCSYLLTTDLDLTNYPGVYIPYFSGIFNGNGFIIDNLNLITGNQYSYLGLFGLATGSDITNCYVTNAEVTGYHAIGGLVGYNLQTSISNSSCTGSVTGAKSVGGLIGLNAGSDVFSCFSKGSVTGNEYIGGLVGANGTSVLSNSYSMSSVSGSYQYVGGLVGRHTNSQIFNCYSTGLVTGTNLYIGGLAGWGSNPADDNNYWNIETSGQATSPIGEGRTTAEMTFPYAVNTYIDWDFEEIWAEDISGLINDGYPFLEWQLDYLRNIAFNPLPTDGSVNIPVTLQEMSWNYILFPVFSAPDGFRLYLNTTGNFSEDDDYAWIPYYENQIEYSCSEVLTELAYSTTYYWQVIPSTIDFYEASSDHDKIPRNDAQNCPVWNFTTEQDSSLDDTEIPLSTELIGNFPNPFNPETTIKFSLSQQGEVKLTIYNIKGRLVRTLLDEYRELGEHHVVWNGQDERGRVVPSGVYLYQLITERETISRKMMLLK